MSNRRSILTVLVSLCTLAGLLFASASASARLAHPYECQVTASATPSASECNLVGNVVPGGPFGAPQGLAVDGSGHLYVGDGTNKVVDVFDSAGNFTRQITGTSPSAPFTNPWGVAIDESGDAWVSDIGPGLIDKFSSAGGFLEQGTGEGHWTGKYTRSVAFSDASKQAYVADSEADDLWVLNSDGTFNKDITGPWGTGCCYIYAAADNSSGADRGDIYVSSNQKGVFRVDGAGNPAEFSESGKASYISGDQLTGTPDGSFGEPWGVAVDSAGNLYVLDKGKHVIDEFNSAGLFVGEVNGNGVPGGSFTAPEAIAAGPTGKVYVADRGTPAVVDVFGPSVVLPDVTNGPATNVEPTTVTLTGTVNPDEAGAATCQFVWGATSAYGHVASCSAGVPNGGSPVAVHAQLVGLEPNTTYHYRLQASNANGTNPGEGDRTFTTTGPPIVSGESVTSVTGDSATLGAGINPHGVPTTYYFQYGTSIAYGSEAPVPPGTPIGSGEEEVSASVHLQGLVASTVYHYRVVAVNAVGTADGPDESFVTQAAGTEQALADNRVWEMVTPPEKYGANLEPISEQAGLEQAAAAGDGFTYASSTPVEAEAKGFAGKVQEFSTRGPNGWAPVTITVPHIGVTSQPIGYGPEYRAFSSDLSQAAIQPLGVFNPGLSAEASEQTSFLRSTYVNGNVAEPCTTSCYRPLATGAAGYANVPPGTIFGGGPSGSGCGLVGCGPNFVGATPDMSHVVISSGAGLTPGPGSHGGLYEWSAGRLAFVGSGVVGRGSAQADRHSISDDGSRVVIEGEAEAVEGLLMREIATGETVKLDAVQGGSGEGAAEPEFQAASSDGSRVFFTDARRLTTDAGTAGGRDLYECDMVREAGRLKCQLSDLTPPVSGEGASVQGGVLGVSEDGSWVYFVADGRLGTGAPRGTCGVSSPGACNLFVLHFNGTSWEEPKFITSLSEEDSDDWSEHLSGQPTRVSPDGRWLELMAQESLTGYDNRDAVNGRLDAEVYLYDAGTGKLSCASCDPTGARPVGREYFRLEPGSGGLVGGPRGIWGRSEWVAANVPGWQHTNIGEEVQDYQSRYLSDGGRLFFNTDDALVPQDVNGTQDVYEFEPPGVGTCRTGSVTFSERSGGCVGLVSSGTSPTESGFLDASEGGGDVFFVTGERLVPQDFDTSLDIYDAHECTTQVPCRPVVGSPPPCSTGDACKPAPTPQPAIYGSPSSATFSGVGNVTPAMAGGAAPKSLSRAQKLARALKACHAKRGKARAVCERRARKRYAVKASRKASRKNGKRG